jgi:hypothetical protein
LATCKRWIDLRPWWEQLAQVEAASARAALIQAQVASMMHRFADARHFLARADIGGALSADVNRVLLNVDQACGANLGKVLDERRETARKCGRTEDLVALGALLADLREFTDADRIYRQALESTGTSRHSLWRGFAFSLGCFGESSFLSRKRPGGAVVPDSHRLLAELHQGTRALGGNILVQRSSQ